MLVSAFYSGNAYHCYVNHIFKLTLMIFYAMCLITDSVDSTVNTGHGLGRFVNDSVASASNCKMRVVVIDKTPHLALFATKTIYANEELRYDYGVTGLPWRNEVNIIFIHSVLCVFGLNGNIILPPFMLQPRK